MGLGYFYSYVSCWWDQFTFRANNAVSNSGILEWYMLERSKRFKYSTRQKFFIGNTNTCTMFDYIEIILIYVFFNRI